MFVIREPRTEEIDKFFMEDPHLSYLGLPDNELYLMFTEGKYTHLSDSEQLGLYKDDELILMIHSSLFTRDTISISMFLATKHHHSGLARKSAEAIKEHYKQNSDFTKLLVMSPGSCAHVHKAAEAFGFTLEGRLSKTITWRQELVDLLIYSWNIERN